MEVATAICIWKSVHSVSSVLSEKLGSIDRSIDRSRNDQRVSRKIFAKKSVCVNTRYRRCIRLSLHIHVHIRASFDHFMMKDGNKPVNHKKETECLEKVSRARANVNVGQISLIEHIN